MDVIALIDGAAGDVLVAGLGVEGEEGARVLSDEARLESARETDGETFARHIRNAVGQQLAVARCPAVSDMIAILSPLPAPFVAQTIVYTSGIAARGRRVRVGQIVLCAR